MRYTETAHSTELDFFETTEAQRAWQGEVAASALRQYLTKVPDDILSRQDEAELGHKIHAGKTADIFLQLLGSERGRANRFAASVSTSAIHEYVAETSAPAVDATEVLASHDYPQTTVEEIKTWLDQHEVTEDELVILSQEGAAAQARFVEANLPLVVWVAKTFMNRGIDLSDLVAIGNMRLMDITLDYDFRYGSKFSGLAVVSLRRAMERAIENEARLVRIPVQELWMSRVVFGIKEELRTEQQRDPTVVDITTAVRRRMTEHKESIDSASPQTKKLSTIDAEEIERLLKHQQPMAWLDEPLGDEHSDTLGDLVIDPLQQPEGQVVDRLFEVHIADRVSLVLQSLPEKWAFVIKKMYGLDGPVLSGPQIAKLLGISTQRVHQLYANAKKRLLADPRTAEIFSELQSPD